MNYVYAMKYLGMKCKNDNFCYFIVCHLPQVVSTDCKLSTLLYLL